jgi:hypothetical protein
MPQGAGYGGSDKKAGGADNKSKFGRRRARRRRQGGGQGQGMKNLPWRQPGPGGGDQGQQMQGAQEWQGAQQYEGGGQGGGGMPQFDPAMFGMPPGQGGGGFNPAMLIRMLRGGGQGHPMQQMGQMPGMGQLPQFNPMGGKGRPGMQGPRRF